ncbi:MAG: sigma-54-dependent Fis family transcriptional regulator, partial [Anaerolineae bacterium]|nr:sigma-54-dependent Fis family transcriptional regulator [Anaerolineae bacterium]
MSNKFAAQCNVLLVDDSPDLLPMLEHLLTAEGYRVQTAASRDQALERLQEERF